jgi:DNA-binding response OmpR family regulator
MNRILLATVDRDRLKELAEAMAAGGEVQIAWADSGAAALADVVTHPPLAVIVDATLPDMEGLELVRRLLPINAMVHTAVISELPAERFHEVSEGLGVLGRLPPKPTAAQAAELLGRLRRLAAGLRPPPP